MKFFFSITTVFLLFFCDVSIAQNQPKNPCSGEKYTQFDFWEGNWNVYDTKGNLIGTNNLVKMQSNCVMQENWESKVGPSKGTSYNYYNKADDSWNQVWVSNTGNVLVLKGGLVDGNMILKSDVVTSPKGKYINRITWSKNTDGSVTQVWDILNTEGKIISESFRGIYKKD